MESGHHQLTLGICYYQDVRGLKRLLDSASPHVSEALVIDGTFTDFGAKPATSDDGSKDLCDSYPNVRYIPYPATEVDKRNKYLDECKTDFLLIIDSDEWIEGSWDNFYMNLQSTNKNYHCFSVWGCPVNARLIYRPNEMEYKERHFILKRKDAQYIPDQWQPTGRIHSLIPGIRIRADDKLRSPEYLKAVQDYQQKLVISEHIRGGYPRSVWD